MPSLATSEVEPTASAPSATAGELATAAIATNATTQPSFIISPSNVRYSEVSGFADNRQSPSPANPPQSVPDEHQRDPLVERDARHEPQPLHPIGGDCR